MALATASRYRLAECRLGLEPRDLGTIFFFMQPPAFSRARAKALAKVPRLAARARVRLFGNYPAIRKVPRLTARAAPHRARVKVIAKVTLAILRSSCSVADFFALML